MGARVSSLVITLNDDQLGDNELQPVSAGSVLRGKINVELSQPLPMDAAVKMRFYGTEKVLMNRRKSKITHYNDSGSSYPTKSAQRQLISVALEWPEFPVIQEGTVPAGTYVFPFCVELPCTLPSSTYYPNDNRKRSKLRFRIQYKISTTVFWGSKAAKEVTKYIWVKAAAPPPQEPVPCMIQPIAHNIDGRLVRKGQILLGAAVDDCRMSESIRLHLACRNDSCIDITGVEIKFIEKLTWGTTAVNNVDPTTGAVHKSSTLQQTKAITLKEVHPDMKLPGLVTERKGVLKSMLQSIGVGKGAQQKELLQEIYNDLKNGTSLICIERPTGARESYVGQLLQVEHSVRVEFQTQAAIANKLIAEIPIYVLSTGQPGSSPPQPSGAGEAYRVAPPIEELIPAETGVATSDPEVDAKKAVTDIPLVSARPLHISDDAAIATTISTDAEAVVLGGDAIFSQSSRRRLEDLVVLKPPTVVSVSSLLSEMRSCINDVELISEKLLNDGWKRLFQRLSSDEFGAIISCVNEGVEQPHVALLLAPHMGLTCDHVVAALRNTSEPHRATLVQQLLPFCTDAGSNIQLIRNELSVWEITVVGDVLGNAEQRAGSNEKA